MSTKYALIAMLLLTTMAISQEANLTERSSGTAPFAVFFDAISNESGIVQPTEINGRKEYADFHYSWDFGDNSSHTWPLSEKSKNSDIGYVASHLYEDPGTYVATLTVTSHTGEVYFYTQDITVLDPNSLYAGEKTICFSNTGNFAGAPEGALHVNLDDITDLSIYFKTGNRLLLRRGDSWNTSGYCSLQNIQGPLFIGAYGEGTNPDERGIFENAPLITVSQSEGQSSFFSVSRSTDCVISELHLKGDLQVSTAIGGSTDITNLTIDKMHIEGFRVGISLFHYNTEGHKGLHILNSKIHNADGNIAFVGAENLVLQGNLFYEASQSHVLRVWQGYKTVIGHNVIHGSSINSHTGRLALKFHGPSEEEIVTTEPSHLEQRSRYAVIYDNIFGTSGPWPVTIGPQNDSKDERIQDILVEGNRFLAGWGTFSSESAPVSTGLRITASYVTVRNNIFDGTGSGPSYFACAISPTPVVASVGNRVYNNTAYKNDFEQSSGSYLFARIYEGTEHCEIVNNLQLKGGNNPASMLICNDNGTTTRLEHNLLLDDLSTIKDAENENILLRDFSLLEQSPAINAGVTVPVYCDYQLRPRLPENGIDIGAHEFQKNTPILLRNSVDRYQISTSFDTQKLIITISVQNIETEIDIHLYNAQGRVISRLKRTPEFIGNHRVHFPTINLSPGLYFMSIQCNDHVVHTEKRLIVH